MTDSRSSSALRSQTGRSCSWLVLALSCQGGKDALKGGGAKDLCKGGKGNDSASACEVEKSI